MTLDAYRALLNAILALLASRISRIAAIEQARPNPDSSAFAEALLPAVEAARRQAWAASVLYMRASARALGAQESWVAAPPPYTSVAVRAAVRRAGDRPWAGLGLDRLMVTLERHAETAARQAVDDAVATAPAVAKRVEDDDLLVELADFPDAVRDAVRREVEVHELSPRGRMDLSQALATIADRVDNAVAALQDAGLASEVPEGARVLAVSDDARRDVTGALIARPFAWARVVQPGPNGPCGFCAMLASRGPVYRSSAAAGKGVRAFHDRCRCVVVPVYTSRVWEGKEDAARYARVYDRVVRRGDLHGSEARTAMDVALRGDRNADKHGKES